MGRTYEAFEQAEKEHRAVREETLPVPLPVRQVELYRPLAPRPTGPYDELKANLLSRYRDGSVKTILFAGTAIGVGTSTTAVNFAISLASDPQLKILLIDVNSRTPGLHQLFRIDCIPGLSDLVAKNGRKTRPIKVGAGNLHVLPCGGRHAEFVTLLESERFDRFLTKAREVFDYVVLDAPPVHGSSECRVLCTKVDGVVLVIEAGKTRRQVALNAKKQLEEAGGKILGVVLNKRRFYIPEFIYRRL